MGLTFVQPPHLAWQICQVGKAGARKFALNFTCPCQQQPMPINLRYDLRFRFERTLARRLEAAWRKIDRMGELAVKPTWWDAFHANRMKRSFIRHRSMYPIKARVHVAFTHAAAIVEGGGDGPEGVLIFLPFYVLAWLIAPRPFPRPAEVLGEYDAFLLRCEIEDLQDELQRRIDKRKRRHAT